MSYKLNIGILKKICYHVIFRTFKQEVYMCKKKKRKYLYHSVMLYKKGLLSGEQVKQDLYYYVFDVVTEDIYEQINKCLKKEKDIYAR